MSGESRPEVDASTDKDRGEGAELGEQDQGLWLQRVMAGQYKRVKCAHLLPMCPPMKATCLCGCGCGCACGCVALLGRLLSRFPQLVGPFREPLD